MWEKDNTYSSATKNKKEHTMDNKQYSTRELFAGLHLILKNTVYLVDGSVLCSTDHGL